MQLWQFLGSLHPKLVHFPLVLLLAGLLFDFVGLLKRSERCHWAGKILSAAGTVSLLVAFVCGIYAEVWAGRAGIPQGQIELHELFANVASWGFVILAAWRVFLHDVNRRGLLVYTLIGLGWYVLMIITAHLGGALIFDYGAAVTSAHANTTLSLHDLNALATRQTDLNLRYSEMMHHIFGYLTLALAGSLFVQAIYAERAARVKWVGPGLLLAGGVFLFFFADLDLYRLTDFRQFGDREVQLHKTIALILVAVGAIGLRGSTVRVIRFRREGLVTRPGQTPAWLSQESQTHQGKMVAVMALIGGGLLFTHVHTIAPYANVAAGVYIAHIVLGTVALLIGATRLLADAWPERRRLLSIAFAGLLCMEAVLLITYNEGLPWYLGYGSYNRWGPHGGTVAPFGACRAELTFDPESQRLDVYVLDRFSDKAVPVAASNLDVLIGRGYQETAANLHVIADAGDVGERHSHFAALVPSLNNVAAFGARLALPLGSPPALKTGYFDPWVTPVITAIPPNEVAGFQCPMHEGIRATEAGNCKLCGMPMLALDKSIRTELHDLGYEMALWTDEMAGDPLAQRLNFRPAHGASVIRDLVMVHEHPLHLIIVSTDLSFFDHVHPLPQKDGSLVIEYQFPRAGHYLLFADITPKGDRSQVFRIPINVGEVGDDVQVALTASAAMALPLAQPVDRGRAAADSPGIDCGGPYAVHRPTHAGWPADHQSRTLHWRHGPLCHYL